MSDTAEREARKREVYQHRIRAGSDAIHLHTLAGIVKEMSRVYRLGLNQHISTQEGARLIYQLTQIRDTVEMLRRAEPEIIEPQRQLEAPIVIATIPSGFFLSEEQVLQLRKREHELTYGVPNNDGANESMYSLPSDNDALHAPNDAVNTDDKLN